MIKKINHLFYILALFIAAGFSSYSQSSVKTTNSTQAPQANEWYASPCNGTNYWNFGTLTPTNSLQMVGGNNYNSGGPSLLGMGNFVVVADAEHYCFQLKITGSGYPYGGGGEIEILDKACGTASQVLLADYYVGTSDGFSIDLGTGTLGPGNQITVCGCWTSSAADVGKTYYLQLSEGHGGGSYFGAAGFCTVYFYYEKGDYTCSGGSIVLPIELTKFTAQQFDTKTKLEWATASETNNNYFTVQRSANGKDFIDVETVKGAGNSYTAKNYTAIDEKPMPGINYYRLKQTDLNGVYKNSNIISVNCKGKNPEISDLFPNPANATISFNLYSPSKASADIQVIDVTGRIVIGETQDVTEGNQLINTSLSSLEGGIYSLRVSIDQIGYCNTIKLVKN